MLASAELIRKEASGIASHVENKILELQEDFLSDDRARSTAARARLARLRRLGTPGGGALFFVGADIFTRLPKSFLPQRERKRAFKTIWSTMRLYAIHQQSQTVPMAITYDQKKPDNQKKQQLYRSFGWSCRQIEHDLDESEGIRLRLVALEAAGSNFDGIEHNVRALITLMKSKSVPVDYYLLACDLYLLQFYNTREEVLLRWGRHYFNEEKTTKDEATESYKH